MMTEALKSCPFCGNPNPEIRHNNIGDSFVICHTDVEGEMCCGASSSECGCETDAGAVQRWNLRAPPASPTGRQLGPGKRDELPPIVSEGVERDARIRELEGALAKSADDHEALLREWMYAPFPKEAQIMGSMPMPSGPFVKAADSIVAARSALSKATGEGG